MAVPWNGDALREGTVWRISRYRQHGIITWPNTHLSSYCTQEKIYCVARIEELETLCWHKRKKGTS